ncbi:MAG: hypothetical protein GPJ54_18100 [Candidatus Heimdallarchaeota archaeon]|nr:hypothetical protein [Candidatus Heimdallarchaeota archaeon]
MRNINILCILGKTYKFSSHILHVPTTVEIKGVLEEKMELLLRSGLYASKSEIVRAGLRQLLESQDFLSIALHLYKNKEISTGRAAGIADMTVAEFVIECQRRKVPLDIGIEDTDDLKDEINLLRKLRK